MKRERRQQIQWELIDSMLTKVEYWNEDPTYEHLTETEFDYLFNVISTFAKQRNIKNHVNIK